MIRLPPCSASESTIARPPLTSRTVPLNDDLLLEHAHAAKLHREPLEPLRAAEGLGVGASHLGHRPQPVQDAAGEAHLLGELLVDVDRVEVTRGAGVADA